VVQQTSKRKQNTSLEDFANVYIWAGLYVRRTILFQIYEKNHALL